MSAPAPSSAPPATPASSVPRGGILKRRRIGTTAKEPASSASKPSEFLRPQTNKTEKIAPGDDADADKENITPADVADDDEEEGSVPPPLDPPTSSSAVTPASTDAPGGSGLFGQTTRVPSAPLGRLSGFAPANAAAAQTSTPRAAAPVSTPTVEAEPRFPPPSASAEPADPAEVNAFSADVSSLTALSDSVGAALSDALRSSLTDTVTGHLWALRAHLRADLTAAQAANAARANEVKELLQMLAAQSTAVAAPAPGGASGGQGSWGNTRQPMSPRSTSNNIAPGSRPAQQASQQQARPQQQPQQQTQQAMRMNLAHAVTGGAHPIKAGATASAAHAVPKPASMPAQAAATSAGTSGEGRFEMQTLKTLSFGSSQSEKKKDSA